MRTVDNEIAEGEVDGTYDYLASDYPIVSVFTSPFVAPIIYVDIIFWNIIDILFVEPQRGPQHIPVRGHLTTDFMAISILKNNKLKMIRFT